jgi:predicted transcriptional regulator
MTRKVSMPRTHKAVVHMIGPLQVRVMNVMWADPLKTSVHSVHKAINDENTAKNEPHLAYTTILTVMRNLSRQGIVTQTRGTTREHVFRTAVSQSDYRKFIAKHVLDLYFGGDKKSLTDSLPS